MVENRLDFGMTRRQKAARKAARTRAIKDAFRKARLSRNNPYGAPRNIRNPGAE